MAYRLFVGLTAAHNLCSFAAGILYNSSERSRNDTAYAFVSFWSPRRCHSFGRSLDVPTTHHARLATEERILLVMC